MFLNNTYYAVPACMANNRSILFVCLCLRTALFPSSFVEGAYYKPRVRLN